MPRNPIGKKRFEYDVPACFQWLRNRDAKSNVTDPSGDPLLSGSNSPALEMYREERAKLARLDRMEREGELLHRDFVNFVLGNTAQLIRGAGVKFDRLPHDADVAFEIWTETINELETIVNKHIGEEDS